MTTSLLTSSGRLFGGDSACSIVALDFRHDEESYECGSQCRGKRDQRRRNPDLPDPVLPIVDPALARSELRSEGDLTEPESLAAGANRGTKRDEERVWCGHAQRKITPDDQFGNAGCDMAACPNIGNGSGVQTGRRRAATPREDRVQAARISATDGRRSPLSLAR
jgi:hypothetical protein